MASPCQKGGMRLSEALDNMQLAYNPITKQLHFVSPKVEKPSEDTSDDLDKLSKKSSFSDEGNFSISTCEKSDTSDSPKSTLNWGGSVSGHKRGKDGGSFSSTVSSLSECSLGSSASKEDIGEVTSDQEQAKLKKKGLSGFFSRGVFPWKSSSSSKTSTSPTSTPTWRLFGSRSSGNLQREPAPAPPAPATPHHHRRQGSSASDKQFEDLVASSIALIQHDRPSNLPAKTTEEALRHKAEHARILEAARRRVERESAARLARLQESLRQEERLARHAREWQAILPDWSAQKNAKRTQELWWSGLPPSIRGKVWQLAIENKLQITHHHYREFVAKAKQRLHEAQLRRKRLKIHRESETEEKTEDKERLGLPRNFSEQNLKCHSDTTPKCCSKSNPDLIERSDECSMELIELDIARTFPQLCIFQPGGPYFTVLHELLAAYVCYRPDVGYVQGMSFIAAVLILNMEAPCAFVCFANLLEQPVLRAAFTRDGNTMQRFWRAYTRLLKHNLPSLADTLAPELYLLEWLYTAFAKAMPLDAACRVWDVFHRDGGAFLFNTALGTVYYTYTRLLKHNLPSLADTLAPELYLLEWLYTAFAKAMPLDAACRVWDVFHRDGGAFLFNTALGTVYYTYTRLLKHNLPSLADTLAPELYLLEWLYTAFAKAMPLDAACRVWDVFHRDGGAFLFNTALGILHLYQDELRDMDFISAAQFLTKLPDDLDSEALFRSISSVSMTLDGMTFEDLVLSEVCEDEDVRL
ncbi:TBC1 domain family member 14-like isoform X1 [Cydia amplana]|uniref:TBC1 domain family member 14-like isoform X1 n=1 Tax=Cydia amplana TaxID=1869771 RepID=UPI002FE5B8E4